ncbi:MAG TPA: TlpA disulfide reductase family protein [Vicinamibacterales bacterium]|nr:TlpA disulfide reductase family protein [Vicinamibacterales bacterium]
MTNLKSVAAAVMLAAIIAIGLTPTAESSLAGRWNGTIVANNVEVPFVFEITEVAGGLRASFFNGDRRITSTTSRVDTDQATFDFAQYATKLTFAVRDGQLTGEYQRARGPFPFRAERATPPRISPNAPLIDGTWIVTAKSNKGEAAWRFIARQNGGEVSATILRVDGDTGTLTGAYRDGRFILSHFSGARPLLLEVTPGPDGTLLLKQNGQPALLAAREHGARAKAIGRPTDPGQHTRVADRSEPFRFNFPDLDGRRISHTDARFAGKVLLVNVSGSWCPNCHDEAPFLAALYKKYRAKGLEVVTLSFEEDDQLKNPTRLRAFIQTYGFEHTVLIPGNPDQAEEKLPQAVNLNAFPTTFLLGRDGRVRGVHAGFPSPGSGEFYRKAEMEITTQVERLLAERQPGRTKW